MSYNESLSPNSNYPPMSQSEWDNAPWNEKEVPEKPFNIYASQSLSKDTWVTTKDYGEDINFEKAYKEEHMTPLQLINEFKALLTKHLPDPIVNLKEYRRWKHLIAECEGWEEDDFCADKCYETN